MHSIGSSTKYFFANPACGLVKINKTDLSDGFYHVDLNINDVSKLGVVFHTKPGTNPMVALPLLLPVGWKNSPLAFSTATKIFSDLANQWLSRSEYQPPDHRLDHMAT